jgi:DNA-directed RNA polymerase subunit beta'
MMEMLHEKQATDFDAIRLSIASPDRILEWSHGKVTKPETINYRTQKPEKDGLFCERIFGPTKDWECYCGKYKGSHYRGITCDRCGVLVARSIVRRERMGHISLAVPVTHVWFLRGTPSSVGLLLNMTTKNLEKIAYFANYVVTKVNKEQKKLVLKELEEEYSKKKKEIENKFDSEATQENVKKVAEQRSSELTELEDEYAADKFQIEGLHIKTLISEADHRELVEIYPGLYEAKIGAEAILELLSQLDFEKGVPELAEAAESAQGQRRKKLLKRLKMMEGMKKAGIKPESMILQHVPVIPPDLRPMVQLTGGRFATSDLNDLYRRVINRNNRLQKLMDMHAPEIIRRNEMRMLQEAVDALIDNSHARGGRAVSSTGGRRKLKSLSDMLRGKQGRFRQNLLGKRVDYSGRSVIVAGPELKFDECGLPKMMALELFKPFVIGALINKDLAHNVKVAGRMIETGLPEVWDALDEIIKDKYVLLNRAPTLHRLGVQAFKPTLIEGKAIQLHPLVCKGFNADFDGDQMAVHLPLSAAAQAEAKTFMAASNNLLKPSDGNSIVYISQEMVLGIYYMTYDKIVAKPTKAFASLEEALYSYDNGHIQLQTPIILEVGGQTLETTVGRALFNDALPANLPYLNETFGDKRLQLLLTEIFEQYGKEIAAVTADQIKQTGFKYATASGLSTGLEDYIIPTQKNKLLEKGEAKAKEISVQFQQGLISEAERYRLTVEVWRKVTEEIQDVLKESFSQQDNSTTISVVSGARAKLSSVSQIAGMLGLRQDVYGNTIELPVKSNYKEGLSSVEYFIDSRGSRKGLVDTALKTADSGYLTRRLVDVAQDVFTIEDDCGEEEGLQINRAESEAIGETYTERLVGRVSAKAIKGAKGEVLVKKGQLITKDLAKQIGENDIETVYIRSILKCLSLRGACRACYGLDLARGAMVDLRVPVGVIAAQAVGEPCTQLTLRTFHSGGASGEDITHGFPRIEELFEARIPKGQAILADINGQVSVREDGNHYVLTVKAKEPDVRVYEIGKLKPLVASGDVVEANQVLAADQGGKKAVYSQIAGMVKLKGEKVTVASDEILSQEYTIPGYRNLTIKDGQTVTSGQRLTTGSINLQDLLRLTDEATVQRYIMTEIQSIFNLQGQTIADKHLEVIIHQMFSKVQIEDPGDSLFVTGDIVSKATVVEENGSLNKDKKDMATYKQLLLGIIKVSTWSDSFLSAASFQDTTRVLISSAVSGRIDRLYGLKENVIIGRQIPVGTGYHGVEDVESI